MGRSGFRWGEIAHPREEEGRACLMGVKDSEVLNRFEGWGTSLAFHEVGIPSGEREPLDAGAGGERSIRLK
jgi:hypothetical protein